MAKGGLYHELYTMSAKVAEAEQIEKKLKAKEKNNCTGFTTYALWLTGFCRFRS